jgi:hypothetical protein
MVHELTQGPHRARVEAASAWTLQIQAGLPIANTRQIAPPGREIYRVFEASGLTGACDTEATVDFAPSAAEKPQRKKSQ